MIRSGKFLISQKPYAVNLDTVTGEHSVHHGWTYFTGKVDAVWFRRKDKTTRACLGSLYLWSNRMDGELDLSTPETILSFDFDGTGGANCYGRWDGENYWGSERLDVQERHLDLLRPMLANFPTIPAGFDGWWRFRV